jgi:hypothetical protein
MSAPHDTTIDATPEKTDFIRNIVREDLASGKHAAIRTRFPPEPNGYLHIGHAKAICLDFGIAAEFGGDCNLRLDDTNPAKEDPEYVRAIQDDVHWLGFDWHSLRHASDYFEVLYLAAEKLIRQGDAFVCDLSAEEVREYRGSLTEPGRNSPFRDRSIEENLDLFRRMRAGEFVLLRQRPPEQTEVGQALVDPVVQRPVVLELQRAQRMGDAFDRVAERMREVVHRVDRPLVAGVLVLDVLDPVQRRVAQVDVAAGHVDLRAQGARAVRELARAHAPEQVQVLLDAAPAVRRVAARFGQRAAVRAHLVGAEVADERVALPDQLLRRQVEHVEVVGRVAQAVPVEAQPAHVVLDGAHVLGVFLGRVGVVQAQVAGAAELRGDAEVQADRLGVADVQVAVGLRREAGADGGVPAAGQVVADDLADEVAADGGGGVGRGRGGGLRHGSARLAETASSLAERPCRAGLAGFGTLFA